MTEMSFKWFLGLAATDPAPIILRFRYSGTGSALVRLRKVFNRIVKIAEQKGLVHERLKIIDSTDMSANVDLAEAPRQFQDVH